MLVNDDTFVLYAIKHYDNPSCHGLDEFYEDIKRFKYIKRLLSRYHAGAGLKERLILNHIIVLNNLFGAEPTTQMLFFKIDDKYWPEVKTFLLYLNLLRENSHIFDGTNKSTIPINAEIAKVLRTI